MLEVLGMESFMKSLIVDKFRILLTWMSKIKFEIKVICIFWIIFWSKFGPNRGYSSFVNRATDGGIWILLWLIFALVLVDFFKTDKVEYVKNSYYVKYREDHQKNKFQGLGKGTEFIFNSIMLIGALVILCFLFCALTGFDIGIYVLASVLGGVYILFMIELLRRKLLDERMGYIDEISKSLEGMMQGNLNMSVPESEESVFLPLAKNINQMRLGYGTALEEKMKSERMKSELITNVSHDLKTPLTSIINYVDLLKKEDLTPEHAKDYVLVLEKKTQRLHALIQDLFEISCAVSGNMKLEIQELDVVELLRQTLAEQDEDIMNSKLDFVTELPNSPVMIQADGSKLHRVFENLISNALKYSLAGTRVYVNLQSLEGFSQITFKNIANYPMNFDSNEILQRFTRADSARSTEGSGLGLAIAESFLEQMGMKIQIFTDGDLFKVQIDIPTK